VLGLGAARADQHICREGVIPTTNTRLCISTFNQHTGTYELHGAVVQVDSLPSPVGGGAYIDVYCQDTDGAPPALWTISVVITQSLPVPCVNLP
jgi:hypothetical protein